MPRRKSNKNEQAEWDADHANALEKAKEYCDLMEYDAPKPRQIWRGKSFTPLYICHFDATAKDGAHILSFYRPTHGPRDFALDMKDRLVKDPTPDENGWPVKMPVIRSVTRWPLDATAEAVFSLSWIPKKRTKRGIPKPTRRSATCHAPQSTRK